MIFTNHLIKGVKNEERFLIYRKKSIRSDTLVLFSNLLDFLFDYLKERIPPVFKIRKEKKEKCAFPSLLTVNIFLDIGNFAQPFCTL